jgi:nitroimidazol reductase NimA-like FMN-containing flavoprotein (pyridoxamine 5'-phosphate oxidase superfamily)
MKEKLLQEIRSLLKSQRLGVLATSAVGHPYTSLVAFAETDDLRHVLFASHGKTRKVANIQNDPRVTLLLDNRSNQPEDFRQAEALTVMGTAEEIPPAERQELAAVYLAKHPYLKDFLSSPGCMLFSIQVKRYSLVQRFQDVVEVIFDEAVPAS